MLPFFDSISNSGLKQTILLMGLKNQHQPSKFWITESVTERAMSFIVYIIVWIYVLYGVNVYYRGHKISMVIGFIVGLLLLMLYDYLSNSVVSLAIDQNTKEYVSFNPDNQYISLDDKFFNLKKTNGVMLKKDVYDKLVKEKKINTVTLQEFRDDQYVKTLGSINQENPLWGVDYGNILLISGSYMFITIITSCIFASHHNKKLLNAQLPFAVASGIFSVAILAIWMVAANYSYQNLQLKLKSKLFIIGFSFAITTVVTPFFFS